MNNKIDKDKSKYEDIIHLPHHVSSKRSQMSLKDRAAQFAPFAAVVGHEKAVKETARLTEQRRELDEMEKAIINEQLREIEAQLPDGSDVEVVYYEPDELKAGGEYITKIGTVKKIDIYEREILMNDGTRIAIEEIFSIVSNVSKSDQ